MRLNKEIAQKQQEVINFRRCCLGQFSHSSALRSLLFCLFVFHYSYLLLFNPNNSSALNNNIVALEASITIPRNSNTSSYVDIYNNWWAKSNDNSIKQQVGKNHHHLRRDLSNYTVDTVGDIHKTTLKTELIDAGCLFFECSKNIAQCDNTLPTNYDGFDPPCCTHILRDMARVFDEAMTKLGLDYVAVWGTLLGLRRADRLIPWTGDGDYLIPSVDVANAMVTLWDNKTTGMAHVFQDINRMCITSDFAGGKLQFRWGLPKPLEGSDEALFASGIPYLDLYIGRKISNDMYEDFPSCFHLYRNMFPTKRALVYNGTFAQNIPANPDQVLRTYYGKNWRIPPSDKDPHGSGSCFGPTLS